MNDTMAKYRLRTWLRGHFPSQFVAVFPKGRQSCGAHEWYRADEDTWGCYHCEVGVTHESPWSPEQEATLAAEALAESLRLDELRVPDQQTIAEETRIVRELDSAIRARGSTA